jgi:hypothetical protein
VLRDTYIACLVYPIILTTFDDAQYEKLNVMLCKTEINTSIYSTLLDAALLAGLSSVEARILKTVHKSKKVLQKLWK